MKSKLKLLLLMMQTLLFKPNAYSSGITFSNEIVINKPMEEVFSFLSDFENMPKWNYYIQSVKKTTPGETAISTTYHQTRKNDAQDYRVVEWNYPDTIAIETLPQERRLKMQFLLSQQGNATRIIDTWDLDVPFILRPFVKYYIKKAVAENLQKLKTLLENGEVILQDGRKTYYHKASVMVF